MRRQELVCVAVLWTCVSVVAADSGTGVGVSSRPGQLGRAHVLDAHIVDLLANYTREHPDQGHQHLLHSYISEHEAIWGGLGWATLDSTPSRLRNGNDTTILRDSFSPLRKSLAELTLTRRLARDWPKLMMEQDGAQVWEEGVVSAVLALELSLGLVVEETDITWAATALSRLNHVYALNITQLLHAIDVNRTPNVVRDMMEVGILALEDEMFGSAVEWFTAIHDVLSQHKARGADVTLDPLLEEILRQAIQLLHIATTAHDQKLSTAGYEGKPGSFPQPLTKVSLHEQQRRAQSSSIEALLEQIPPAPPNQDPSYTTNRDQHAYNALCRRQSATKNPSSSALRCFQSSLGSPWLLLQPALVEQLYLDPPITAFHNVISEQQMTTLKDFARPLQGRAHVFDNKVNNVQELSRTRTSHNAWLPNSLDPTMEGITKKIEALTGLNLDNLQGGAEDLQVNQYSTGGHYIPHIDCFSLMNHLENADDVQACKILEKHRHGDRIATFMLYLSDVSSGGATVFPRLEVKMSPQAGSAIFWYNLLHNGFADTRTLHAACPVLKGEKWVANKWIKHHPQMLRRPCQLYL